MKSNNRRKRMTLATNFVRFVWFLMKNVIQSPDKREFNYRGLFAIIQDVRLS